VKTDTRVAGSANGGTAQAWKVHVSLWIVQVAFASQAVEGKVAMTDLAKGGGGVAPIALAMTRMAGAAIFFVLFTRLRGVLVKTTVREKLVLAGLSVLGISLNQTLFLVGLKQTSPTAAALLSVTIPVFTAAMAVAARIERVSAPLVSGLALAVVGVLWLTGVRATDRGAAIVTLNSLSYSAYIVLSRRIIQKLGALTVVTWIFVFGALTFAPLGVPVLAHDAAHWTGRSLAFVAYIVAAPTIIAYSCNAWALGRSSPTLVTAYVNLQPILAGLLAWVQLGQPLTSRVLVAAAFILAGVALVVTRPPQNRERVTSPAAPSP
jgi:drug/metabolite transporter (DMT)-like permease